ncbi:MAG: carbon monoxide dehydrogenase accessory protein CooC [Chloroflexota bacterium]
MKIAISGKGGVGKTLLAALLSKTFAESGYSVIAIDADPAASLAATLGFPQPEKITPISEMKELIEERTGARPGQSGPYFTLNPKVDDIPEKYAQKQDGIRLMRMGGIKGGGSGCYCPENALLRTLVAHLLLARNEVVILDMEAGIEHLSRGTAKAVDKLIIVVEPGRRSLETAANIRKLAGDIDLKTIAVVGNKVRDQADQAFLKANLPDFDFLGFIPYDPAITEADQARRSVLDASPAVKAAAKEIYQALRQSAGEGTKNKK